ncbi:hemolysin family protein [Pseudoalteromonas sp. T1lg65]|uniref:hemolysin family protein n=1 Tax=Pseudoalteromonas sp. T1lg65 TaxID=2077101 RepID=UPI003F79BA42
MSDLLAICILILFGALFAMSEISIAAARKIKLRVMVDEGSKNAQSVLALQEQPGRFFAMIQIALNAIAILGGIIGEQALTPYASQLITLIYSGPMLDQISFLLSFFIITSLFILFADLLPKRIAMIMPEAVAIRVVDLMNMVTRALTPLVLMFSGLSNLMLRIFKFPTEREEIVTTEDIVAVMEAGAQDGTLQQQEYHLIGSVFELDSLTIPSVMTTRESIICFDLNDNSDAISAGILAHPHNQFLVCDGSLDKLKGYVESKDILRLLLNGENAQIKPEIVKTDILYLPETLTLSEALNAFKTANQTFAVIVNEYALVVGLVTMKDLIGSFMGDLVTFNYEEQIIQRDANSWLVAGTTPIIDVIKQLDISQFPDMDQYETIAGFLIYVMKRIPKRTDSYIHEGYKFEAIDVEGVRVEQLLISRLGDSSVANHTAEELKKPNR